MKLAKVVALTVVMLGTSWAEVELNPTHFGSYMDFGQAVESHDLKDYQPLSRLGFFMNTSGSYNGKFDISLTAGGLYWHSLPPQDATQRNQLFGFGIGEAQGTYKFGDPESPIAKLQMGLFAHKYNPDAKNLGEYLYRSGTYPGYLWTGGWSWLNSSAYMAQGLRFSYYMLEGKLIHDFAIYQERDLVPAHDLTPSYQVTYKPSQVFEIGAGIAWAHGISFRPDSILSPKVRRNAYNPDTKLALTPEDENKPGYSYYGPGDPRNDSRVVPDGDPRIGDFIPDSIPDPINPAQNIANPDPNVGQYYVSVTDNGTPENQLEYYTFRGFKGMVRTGIDFGAFMELEPGQFKVYGEVALLGIKDYPFYYDKKLERMPTMFGFNFPTFGLLDVFSVEFEYLNSPFKNTIYGVFGKRQPLPFESEADNSTNYRREIWKDILLSNPNDLNDPETIEFNAKTEELEKEAEKDNWKWTVYAKKQLMEGLSLTAQIASDHNRHFEYVFARPGVEPSTIEPSEWYWVLRLDLGI